MEEDNKFSQQIYSIWRRIFFFFKHVNGKQHDDLVFCDMLRLTKNRKINIERIFCVVVVFSLGAAASLGRSLTLTSGFKTPNMYYIL